MRAIAVAPTTLALRPRIAALPALLVAGQQRGRARQRRQVVTSERLLARARCRSTLSPAGRQRGGQGRQRGATAPAHRGSRTRSGCHGSPPAGAPASAGGAVTARRGPSLAVFRARIRCVLALALALVLARMHWQLDDGAGEEAAARAARAIPVMLRHLRERRVQAALRSRAPCACTHARTHVSTMRRVLLTACGRGGASHHVEAGVAVIAQQHVAAIL